MAGTCEGQGTCEINWTTQMDHALLNATDQYISVYGKMYPNDWLMIAKCSFNDPCLVNEVSKRYDFLSQKLTVFTHEDYTAYQLSRNKNVWIRQRKMANKTTCYQRHLQRSEIKRKWIEAAKLLEIDLTFLVMEVHISTMFSQQLWNYLGGEDRISFMLYLNVADNVVNALPKHIEPNVYGWDPNTDDVNESEVEADMAKLIKKYGNFFKVDTCGNAKLRCLEMSSEQKELRGDSKKLNLTPPVPFFALHGLDLENNKRIMEEKRDGLLSPNEWLQLLRNGPHPIFHYASLFYSNHAYFTEHLAAHGIKTKKTNVEILLEFCSHVLPNYWFDWFLREPTGGPLKHYEFPLLDRWACTTIYHSLTIVSLLHVRKTVLYLVAIGILDCWLLTPNEWFDKFISELTVLPSGDAWNANPFEFEKVRKLLIDEMSTHDQPTAP